MVYTRGVGAGCAPPWKFLIFGPHKVVSEAILGHLKQFLNTVHRSVCCNCACVLCNFACVLQLG